MTDEYDRPLGRMEGRAYALVVRATPGFNDPEDFSTSLICRKGLGESEEIVRIDNSHGKGIHIHRLYRRDEPEEPFDGDLWEAVKHIEENWRTYTRRHRS